MPKGALEEKQTSWRPVILVRVGDEEMFEARHISAENRLVVPVIGGQVNLMGSLPAVALAKEGELY